jgi:hypothetical protein
LSGPNQLWSGRWAAAALLASAAYIVAYSQEVTLFYYYPMVNEWHLSAQPQALGPGITYFGWKALGIVTGAMAFLLPMKWLAWISPTVLQWGAYSMVLTVCVHESHWFFR